MEDVFALVALAACAIFTGGALYVSLVEHPGRMEAGIPVAVAEFGPSYRRASVMQGSAAIVAAVAGVIVAAADTNLWWLVGALLVGAVIPWTLVVMMPVNKDLLDGVHAPKPLLDQWARMHAARSVLGVAALVAMIAAVLD